MERVFWWTEIDDKGVAARNNAALELIEKAERDKLKLTSFVYNKKRIAFVMTKKAVEMSNIGAIKFKSVGGIDFDSFRQIDIADIVGEDVAVELSLQGMI